MCILNILFFYPNCQGSVKCCLTSTLKHIKKKKKPQETLKYTAISSCRKTAARKKILKCLILQLHSQWVPAWTQYFISSYAHNSNISVFIVQGEVSDIVLGNDILSQLSNLQHLQFCSLYWLQFSAKFWTWQQTKTPTLILI